MDHYTKLRVIGKGSYGEVWLVKHKRDRKQYVLKKMEISNASRRERKAAEQEAKLLAKLKHPNICSYKDSFETVDGLLYIAMGYCEGGDLYNRLKEQKGTALDERQVVEWFVQIAMALQYMHERNILHRDLKTQNIFLTKSKIIKVGDLGIARVLDSSNDMATTLIGTPYYMSPELFSNKPYNHKSDVWALGCCVYEMATLKHAFNARDMNSLVYKILRGRMPSMPKQYSPELVTLIRAMLNSNPEKRPSVNRILRDPYIKKNISIFLESTRKHTSNKPPNSRRSSTDSQRRNSDISTLDEVPDSARSSVSSVSSVSGVNKAYDRVSRPKPSAPVENALEPLNVGPDLEPIMEEPTPRASRDLLGSGDSRRSGTPTRSRSNTPTRSRPHTPSKHSHPSEPRELPPSGRDSPSKQALRKKRQRLKDSDKDRVSSPQRGSGSHRDNHHNNKPAKNNRVLNNAKPVENPRPLPPRPTPREPASSSAVPRKSQSRRAAMTEKEESGYGSVSSSVNSSKDDPGREDDTPRQSVNLSARARRREKKESETPRTARSLDVDQRREDQRARPRSAGVAKSADYYAHSDRNHRDGDREQPRSRPQSASTADKVGGGVRRVSKQPSLTEETSSESETETEPADNGDKKEREEKKHVHVEISEPARPQPAPRPLPQTTPAEDEPDSGPQGDIGTEAEEEDEEVRKEKEMNNFICMLNSTLQMNNRQPPKVGEETNSGEEDEGVDDVDGVEEPIQEVEEERQEVVVSNFDYEPINRPDPSKSHAQDSSSFSPVKTLGTSTRLMDRITALRKDCIRGLGFMKLKKAYDILDEVDGDQLEEELVLVLGRADFDVFAGKIWQLKFCEEAAFGII